jgi:hypothetical protein
MTVEKDATEITPEDSVVPIYLVPLNQDQIDELEDISNKLESDRIFFEQQQQAIEEAKQSALIKLAALGLTEEEAKAIVGV